MVWFSVCIGQTTLGVSNELGLRKDKLTGPLGIGGRGLLTGEVFLGCSLADDHR